MIINIESIDNMISDLCNVLNITSQVLKETILRFSRECRDGIKYDEDKCIELSEEYVKNNKRVNINEIYVCHLTRYIDFCLCRNY